MKPNLGKRPIAVGKRPIKEGKRPIKAMEMVGMSISAMVENGPSKISQ